MSSRRRGAFKMSKGPAMTVGKLLRNAQVTLTAKCPVRS